MASNASNRKKVLDSAAKKAVTRKAQKVLPVAKSRAGAAGTSLGYTVRGSTALNFSSRVGTNDPDYIFTEVGTRPHFIWPKNGKTLVFPGLGGKTAHATVVFHPGTKGTHALRDALRTT